LFVFKLPPDEILTEAALFLRKKIYKRINSIEKLEKITVLFFYLEKTSKFAT